MKFAIYTNSVSAHQLPLARELAKLVGADNFAYIYAADTPRGNQLVDADDPWIARFEKGSEAEHIVETCDALLVGGIRPIDLIEQRVVKGKPTLFMSERWFKPMKLFNVRLAGGLCEVTLPGWTRLFSPRYFCMAMRFARLLGSPAYRFLPIGPWSERDMRLTLSVMHGAGLAKRIENIDEAFFPWGDFVAPSDAPRDRGEITPPVKVLWAGRMIDWKRVDTLVRAVAYVNSTVGGKRASLTLVGGGPETPRLERLARRLTGRLRLADCEWIRFMPPVTIGEIRPLMRAHDLYVLPSSSQEGWGCVVNEALEEGMRVLGTFEAGAPAAMLPATNLFHCGDWRGLAKAISGEVPLVPVGRWSAAAAATRLLAEAESMARR